jgi:hypothetical protein
VKSPNDEQQHIEQVRWAMAGTRRFVKVFLASPGDLAEERKIAKVIVDDFNSQLADALGYQVELVGWEDTLPGVGRPQAIINRDLDGCDLFIGMLWKRWGTPLGTEPYSSGFEEEFNRSMTRNAKEGRPEINLLLKDLDAASLADPGDHLKKVIAFKEKVFGEKKLLAGTFADVRDFELSSANAFRDTSLHLPKRTKRLSPKRTKHLLPRRKPRRRPSQGRRRRCP